MIPGRSRELKRRRQPKFAKNIERLYKEGKCCDCSVVVTRMDFAKILGKFTKVKIQYESNSTPKTKQALQEVTPKSNARLKSNENGMVLIHRNAYKPHPVKSLVAAKPVRTYANKSQSVQSRQVNNILKENNQLRKTPIKIKNYNKIKNSLLVKEYRIIFTNPIINSKQDSKNNITLSEIMPFIDKNILPNDSWNIDYLPKLDEPTDDKVYDRIAAELEDLMYNEKKSTSEEKKVADNKNTEEFQSLMEILNEKPVPQEIKIAETAKDSKESTDSCGINTQTKKQEETVTKESTSMEVDTCELKELLQEVDHVPEIENSKDNKIDQPNSPSILDEALQKGIEEHLPVIESAKLNTGDMTKPAQASDTKLHKSDDQSKLNDSFEKILEPQDTDIATTVPLSDVTHVIFRQTAANKCCKCVICPKNLKYSIEMDGKEVELLGAPKYISSLEDLKVLLQIVNESEPSSLYVLG